MHAYSSRSSGPRTQRHAESGQRATVNVRARIYVRVSVCACVCVYARRTFVQRAVFGNSRAQKEGCVCVCGCVWVGAWVGVFAFECVGARTCVCVCMCVCVCVYARVSRTKQNRTK